MKIDIHNYEVFFLDYHEGNLSEEKRKEVRAFVAAHPQLKEEFENFCLVSVETDEFTFSGKENLKKNFLNERNYKTWLAAYVENDLNAEEKKETENFLAANPDLKPELILLQRTKLSADHSITFENKSSLKKNTRVIPMWVRVAAAACLVVGLTLYFILQPKETTRFVNTDRNKPAMNLPEADINIGEKHIQKTVHESQELIVQHPKHKKAIHPVQNIPGIPEPLNHKDQKEKNEEIHLVMETDSFSRQPEKSLLDSNRPLIVIHENATGNQEEKKKMEVFNEKDLADLGIKTNDGGDRKSFVANALNSAGELFGIHARYDRNNNLLQSKSTETYALGPLAITRTVSR